MRDEMIPLVILGAGGHGRVIANIVDQVNSVDERFQLLGYVDDDATKHGVVRNDRPVLGDFSWFNNVDPTTVKVVCGVGSPPVRARIAERADRLGLQFCSIVHPTATLSRWMELGTGTVISAGCVVVSQVTLGDHVSVAAGTVIGHDTVVGDYTSLYPGVRLAGYVDVGVGCELGMGAVVTPYRAIGEWTIVGAGAAVTTDLPANCTSVGVPARVIDQRDAGWQNVVA